MKSSIAESKISMLKPSRSGLAASLVVLALSAGLSACQPKPEVVSPEVRTTEPTAGQQVDGALADSERKADQAGAEISQSADQAGLAVRDASITAAVNAKLATDPDLSAFRINVDTEAGRVELSGDAPDLAARARADELTRGVDGVVEVDNQLTIKAKG